MSINIYYKLITPFRSKENNKYNYVYQITEISTGKKYIGSRGSTIVPNKDITYFLAPDYIYVPASKIYVKNNDYGYVKGSDYHTNINLITNKTEKEHFSGLEKMNKDKEEAEKLAVANIASQLMDLNSAKIDSNDFNNKKINISDVKNNVILVEDKNIKTNAI